MNKQLYENTEQIDIDELFEGGRETDPEKDLRRIERRKSSAIKKKKRNLMIANAMIYGGIVIFVLSCVIIGYFIFMGNRGKEITSISFAGSSIIVKAGHTASLTVKTKPDDVEYLIRYAVSDESVAEVSASGVLTAIKAGTVTVTAESGGLSAVCTVIVLPDTITDISTEEQELVLKGGEKRDIGFSFSPSDATDRNIVWSSSESSVAVVDQNGTVKGVDSGEAIITVTDTVTGLSKDVKITVVSVEAPESISFEESELTLEVGDTHDSTILFVPSDISDKSVFFTCSDSDVASISDKGVITALSEGRCEITCFYENLPSIICKMTLTVIDPFIIVS